MFVAASLSLSLSLSPSFPLPPILPISLPFLRFRIHLRSVILSITHFLCFMKSRGLNPVRQAAKILNTHCW